jgi:hypothetical protein
MLRRMWGKRIPHTMLVGMEASTITMEKNMETPQKNKNRSALFSRNSTPRDILEGM